jgi:hypothetical protein
MKKIIKFLPAMAILLASGLAVATTSKTMVPQYYKNSAGAWLPLAGSGIVLGNASGQYSCDTSDNQCTAEGYDGHGPTGEITRGFLRQNP